MSWFDEAVARRQRAQRTDASRNRKGKHEPEPDPVDQVRMQQQEVEALNPLMERLLSEYGERVFGKGLLQKRYIVRLERPGKSKSLGKSWNWHWHLDSLVKDMSSVEVHPTFDADGMIQSFLLISGHKRVKTTSADEAILKEALVSLYLDGTLPQSLNG
ncbi:MAG: hypothetical protein M3Z24_15215 [Chloroflexota bacterium]|nr:hypothetical protein [Chloroflexota bacterium]